MSSVKALLFLVFLTSGVQAQARTCRDVLRPHFIVSQSPITQSQGQRFIHWEQPSDLEGESFSYYFKADLSEDGILTFDAFLKHDHYRSDIRGQETFVEALAYFGSRVKKIRARWTAGDNFNLFENLVEKQGVDPREAAFQTWTGSQAAKAGFTEITTLDHYFKDAYGFGMIVVDFIRPESSVH